MAALLLGAENEYAISASSWIGDTSCETLAHALVERIARRYPCIRDAQGHGYFLLNGARVYVDCGNHPEISSPECTDPRDVVRYVRAGERMLVDAVQELEEEGDDPGLDVLVSRGNVDYVNVGATWGAHESYLYTTHPGNLPAELIPHLVTRLIYSGAGGFNPRSPGLEFLLSPRSVFFDQAISRESTRGRAIFHTKDEALGPRGVHRLHVICGESLGSDRALTLKLGTTALILALVDDGLSPGKGVALADPVEALQIVARDPSGSLELPLEQGSASALAIQWHYLHEVERHLGTYRLPAWAPEIVELWAETLRLLARGPEAVATQLDWAIRWQLYQDHVRRRGQAWGRLKFLAEVLGRLRAAAVLHGLPGCDMTAVPLSLWTDPRSPIADSVAPLTAELLERRASWSDVGELLRLRRELLEIDVRFSQVGPEGLWARLEQAGVLQHHVAGTDRVEEALTLPPSRGRAQVRGDFIRRSGKHADPSYACAWEWILDYKSQRLLDLSEPFTVGERWKPAPARRESA